MMNAGYQDQRLTNLDLLKRYGKQAWLQQNSRLEAMEGRLSKLVREEQEEANLLNLKRKGRQEEVGVKLRRYEQEQAHLYEKNFHIRAACEELLVELKELRGKCEGEGIEVGEEAIRLSEKTLDELEEEGKETEEEKEEEEEENV